MRNVTPLLALDSAPDNASPVVALTPIFPSGAGAKDRLTANHFARATISVSGIFFTDPGKTLPGVPLSTA